MRRILPALILACLAGPALGQAVTPEPEDADLMSQCLDAAADTVSTDNAVPALSCIGAASAPCMDNEPDGYSTAGMTRCVQRETAWWDARLNTAYAALEAHFTPAVFARMRDAQGAWIAFRDADCAFVYEFYADGTIRSPAHAGCMLDHTAERTLDLEAMLNWE